MNFSVIIGKLVSLFASSKPSNTLTLDSTSELPVTEVTVKEVQLVEVPAEVPTEVVTPAEKKSAKAKKVTKKL